MSCKRVISYFDKSLDEMGALSKGVVPFSCYEVGHTWTPFCPSAAAGVGISCFEEGLKIYSSVYLVGISAFV